MFRTSCLPLVLVTLALVRSGWAQEPDVDARREGPRRASVGQVAASGVVTPTVDMWFYEQEQRRNDDPKMAVRRKAETKAQQRRDRLAAMEWYGMSNSRPMVSCTPWFGTYSAYWGSNAYDPLRWRPTPMITQPVVTTPLIMVARPTAGPY